MLFVMFIILNRQVFKNVNRSGMMEVSIIEQHLSDLRERKVKEVLVLKEDFLDFRNVLIEQEDFKHFRGEAKHKGNIVYTYLEVARS